MQEFNLKLPNEITLSSELKEVEVCKIDDANKRDMGNGYVWYDLPISKINQEEISF